MRIAYALLALLFLFVCATGHAATINAASTSRTDVQNAVNTAVSGDTVAVPAGSSTWSTAVTISGKSLTLQGAGDTATIITDGTGGGAFDGTCSAANFVRVTGFKVIKSSDHSNNGHFNFSGAVNGTYEMGFRLDHNTLVIGSAGTRGVRATGIYGCIDHNVFSITATSGSIQSITIHGASFGSDGGYTPWTKPLSLGTTNAVYVEDNSIQYDPAMINHEDFLDAYAGGRYVIRNNRITNAVPGHHGTDSGGTRSCVSFEVYSNAFVNTTGTQLRALTVRGGTGVVFANTYSGNYGGVNLMYYRAGDGSGCLNISDWEVVGSGNYKLRSASLSANGSRECDTAGTVGFNTVDKETLGSFGGSFQRYFDGSGTGNYPGRDQPGIAPGQVTDPIYVWSNGGHDSALYNGGCAENSFGLANYIQSGRDYINNGSTAKPGYTTLVYPHPLIGGGGGDVTQPTVAITSPTSGTTYDNAAVSSIAMSGTAADDTAVSSVAWSNNRGGSGAATGTTSWSFTATGLSAGHNIITVTATDSSGNTGSDSLDVTYTPTSGNVYYVKVGGSDAANGTSTATPWATLQASANKMVPGDTLYLVTTNGAFNDPDVLDVNNFSSNALVTKFLSFPAGTTATVRGPGTNTAAPSVFNSTNILFQGIIFENFNIGMIVYGGSGYVTFTNCTFRTIGQQGFFGYQDSHHITVTSCLITNTGRWVTDPVKNGEGVYLGSTDFTRDCIVEYCTIGSTTDESIEFKPGTSNCVARYNRIYAGTQSTAEGAIEIDNSPGGFNPNHQVYGNIISGYGNMDAAIRAISGCTVYNNVLYDGGSAEGILAFEITSDTHIRKIFNNTIDASTSLAVVNQSTQVSQTNNIGPATGANLAFNSSYFVNAAARNYALVTGTAPINTGFTLSEFSTDINGTNRPVGVAWDMGAYEFTPAAGGGGTVTNLQILGRASFSGRVGVQ